MLVVLEVALKPGDLGLLDTDEEVLKEAFAEFLNNRTIELLGSDVDIDVISYQ